MTNPVTYANSRAHLLSGIRNIHHKTQPARLDNLTTRGTVYVLDQQSNSTAKSLLAMSDTEGPTAEIRSLASVPGIRDWAKQPTSSPTSDEANLLTPV